MKSYEIYEYDPPSLGKYISSGLRLLGGESRRNGCCDYCLLRIARIHTAASVQLRFQDRLPKDTAVHSALHLEVEEEANDRILSL